jgi:hypothetical protein
MKLAIFIDDLPYMLSTKFQLIWASSFRGEDFLEHGCHRQFLFQIGRFLKIFFPETA